MSNEAGSITLEDTTISVKGIYLSNDQIKEVPVPCAGPVAASVTASCCITSSWWLVWSKELNQHRSQDGVGWGSW